MKEYGTTDCILYNFIYKTFWKGHNYSNENQVSGCQSLGMWEEDWLQKYPRECLIVMELFYIHLLKSNYILRKSEFYWM